MKTILFFLFFLKFQFINKPTKTNHQMKQNNADKNSFHAYKVKKD
ncbi:MAG: hypothetical protein ACOVO9_04810 [Bacteroidia bacterium]